MPISVLVVDDDELKTSKVVAVLTSCLSEDVVLVEHAGTVRAARDRFALKQYDLAVIDIALPEHAEDHVRKGGINLFQEISDRDDLYKMPHHIVGLTAFDDALALAIPAFGSSLWTVLKYDPSSEEWCLGLCRRLKHIMLANRGEALGDYCTYACIVTALQTPELDAVLQLPWNWQRYIPPDDVAVYYKGIIPSCSGDNTVIATACPRMGIASATCSATKMIDRFKPRYLAMAGISGGIKGECQIGDVIAVETSWHWETGKRIAVNGEPRFQPAPYQINIPAFIRSRIGLLQQNRSKLTEIRDSFVGLKPDADLRLLLGPMASGSSVVADDSVIEMITEQNRKVLGIEMEAYGVFSAAFEGKIPNPDFFCFKGVSDLANAAKNDDYRPYAAFVSAQVLKEFLETAL